ncbi:hypothetical protein HMPREF0791_0267 [Staphylococcus epidermidis W23144]|nr:hypothetical protein HMPREF0791_0267 [Staphylococcus epidermidis W23144]
MYLQFDIIDNFDSFFESSINLNKKISYEEIYIDRFLHSYFLK